MTTLTTPAGMSVDSSDQTPEAGRVEGRVGRRLQHDRVPGGERLRELVDADLEREVPRHDRADDADRLAPDLPRGLLAGEAHERVAEVGLPGVRVDQLGGELQRIGQRRVELRAVRQHARTAGLEDQLLAERLPLGFQRRLELLEAALAERAVRSTSRSRRRRGARRRWRAACPPSTRSRRRPSTSSVAGLTFANVPASPSTSLPSISIFGSKRTWACQPSARSPDTGRAQRGSSSPKRATRWEWTPSGSSLRATR